MKILVIGDSMVDVYCYVSVNRTSPEESLVNVADIEKQEYCLGGALNVATNIRYIEDRINCVDYSGVVSTHSANQLSKMGIQCESCYYIFDKRDDGDFFSSDNLLKIRIVDINTKKQLIRMDNRKSFPPIISINYKLLFKKLNIHQYDAIVVSDYCKGLVGKVIVDKLIEFEGPVFVDTKNSDLSIWEKIKECYVKINFKEFIAAGNSVNTIKNLIVTKGVDGAEFLNYGRVCDLYCTKPIENANVIGAGDSFLAAFVVRFIETKDIHTSINFANKVAGLSIKKFGTSIVTRKEILDAQI